MQNFGMAILTIGVSFKPVTFRFARAKFLSHSQAAEFKRWQFTAQSQMKNAPQ